MKISLNDQRRMIILSALRLYQDKRNDPYHNTEIIKSLFQELQPTGVAIDAEVGDFVMLDENCREVARKFQFFENGEVVMVLKPGKYTEDDICHAVFATDVSWPTLLESQN